MNLFPRIAAILVALALPFAASAQAPDADARTADADVAALLDSIEYRYELDEDGDYRLVLEMPDSDRTQLVFVRSPVEEYGNVRVREVWSPAWRGDGEFPAAVANRLLQATSDLKLGAWERQGPFAVLVIKLPADATAKVLEDAMIFAAMAADAMELELSGAEAGDEF